MCRTARKIWPCSLDSSGTQSVHALRGLSLKVSQKGGVSVYGLGRFPVTLYKEQWLRLLDIVDEIRTFIKDNEADLKTKG